MRFGSEDPGGMTVAVIGGGLSGALFALKLAARRPDWRVLLIEMAGRPGKGLAYGACAPYHLLNVPVQRLEVGLTPGFRDWLAGRDDLTAALEESGGDLDAAFVPRAWFGDYIAARLAAGTGPSLAILRGEAVALLDTPRRGVLLRDGREIAADIMVLATGNPPPKAPFAADSPIHDAPRFILDPWAPAALGGLDRDAPVMLIGTGLTMVDIAMRLAADGHRGPMHAVSRHGLLPLDHRFGGAWAPFLAPLLPAGVQPLMRAIRRNAAAAMAEGIPWQRVVDAVRPAIGRVWAQWDMAERRRFLRHARAYWDVHRHRLAPRVAAGLAALIDSGALTIRAGRIAGCMQHEDRIEIDIVPRGGGAGQRFAAGYLINCTGPRGDFAALGMPLIADLRRRGLIRPDALGLGIETADCAVLDRDGRPSAWLFALGPPTRPAWWEITAVPEIAAQAELLAMTLGSTAPDAAGSTLADAFLDLGAGI